MKTWLDKLCEPLEHPKYPQIKGLLFRKDNDGNIIGKCAEGEILCQNNIPLEHNQIGCIYDYQFRKMGVPPDLLERVLPHIFSHALYNYKDYENINEYSIGQLIVTLNDEGFTYPEIVEFLRVTFEDAV